MVFCVVEREDETVGLFAARLTVVVVFVVRTGGIDGNGLLLTFMCVNPCVCAFTVPCCVRYMYLRRVLDDGNPVCGVTAVPVEIGTGFRISLAVERNGLAVAYS